MSSDPEDLDTEISRLDGNINGLYEGVVPKLEIRLTEIEEQQREIETELDKLRNMIAQMEDEE
ncbi:hypothetical protein [Halorubrum saccharovorum]|uniref:hypothetical protein n=1 Tax=Halorubrum saccharovorum TaxID=2248 RepID=UPI001268B889|nr:hypothetical protein [Halorubrum saccharovorum]